MRDLIIIIDIILIVFISIVYLPQYIINIKNDTRYIKDMECIEIVGNESIYRDKDNNLWSMIDEDAKVGRIYTFIIDSKGTEELDDDEILNINLK